MFKRMWMKMRVHKLVRKLQIQRMELLFQDLGEKNPDTELRERYKLIAEKTEKFIWDETRRLGIPVTLQLKMEKRRRKLRWKETQVRSRRQSPTSARSIESIPTDFTSGRRSCSRTRSRLSRASADAKRSRQRSILRPSSRIATK